MNTKDLLRELMQRLGGSAEKPANHSEAMAAFQAAMRHHKQGNDQAAREFARSGFLVLSRQGEY
tara:strand:- start:146 stop:337 length:192 start_codon:yes stop_codon:yes gene_type:complete